MQNKYEQSLDNFKLDFDMHTHVDNIHVTYAEMKHKLLSHLLEHLGYSVTCLQQDYDLRQQLKNDIRWEKYTHETCKEYLSYRSKRIGYVEIVYKDISWFVDGKIYETFI